ncbi:aromatic prenyltransferase [Actinomadura viridis]|uniref:aromatic prenyltransferase n=1 Tax=Actinomadura viridis TaxID=58110 RepID=UPI00368B1859
MSREAAAEKFYSDIEETARLVGVDCSRERISPILSAYRDAFVEGGIVFSVDATRRHVGELNYAFTVPPAIDDPYAHALSNGFVAETDHPVSAVLSDVRARFAIAEHLVDCGVVGGFRKLYAHFPRDLRNVSEIADIPSMPPAVADNVGLFTRYGLCNVAMIGVNYAQKTVSVYSLRANLTLGWDSSEILRIALAPPPRRGLDPSAVPVRIEPNIERFATSSPRVYPGERVNLFAVKWTPAAEYLEVCSYYKLTPMLEKLFVENHEK